MNFKRYHVSKNLFDELYPDVTTTIVYKAINVGNGSFTLSTNAPLVNNGALLFMLAGDVTTGASTSNNGVSESVSRTVTAVNGYITIAYIIRGGKSPADYEVMLNTGSQPLPYEPYGNTWHDTPHYIHNTSTDTLTTLPAVIYANDTTATVGLKGNMEQSSQPSPTTPIQPSECGDLSENLYDASNPNIFTGYYNATTNTLLTTPNNAFIYIPLVQGRKYYVYGCKRYNTSTSIRWATTSSAPFYNIPCIRTGQFAQTDIFTITAEANENYLAIFLCGDSDYSAYGTVEDAIATNGANLVIDNGYKIPILNNSQTTNVYLGEVESTRWIEKLVLTGEESGTWSQNPTITTGNAFYNEQSTIFPNYSPNKIGYCTHFATTTSPTVREGVYWGANINFITDINDNIDTPAKWKQYLADQYAAGTPVCVWYVLATPTTAVVNEPLRKIGDYADEISGITIPTTAGANTLSIGTTLQPSEVTATYKGWHPVQSVHERESGAWT